MGKENSVCIHSYQAELLAFLSHHTSCSPPPPPHPQLPFSLPPSPLAASHQSNGNSVLPDVGSPRLWMVWIQCSVVLGGWGSGLAVGRSDVVLLYLNAFVHSESGVSVRCYCLLNPTLPGQIPNIGLLLAGKEAPRWNDIFQIFLFFENNLETKLLTNFIF
jgi:hypothetical protein